MKRLRWHLRVIWCSLQTGHRRVGEPHSIEGDIITTQYKVCRCGRVIEIVQPKGE